MGLENYFFAVRHFNFVYQTQKSVLFHMGKRFRRYRFAKNLIEIFNLGTFYCDALLVAKQLAYGLGNVGRGQGYYLHVFINQLINLMEIYVCMQTYCEA